MKKYLLAIGLCVFFVSPGFAAEISFNNGAAKLTEGDFEISIKTTPINRTVFQNILVWGGDETEEPKTVITSFQLTIKKEKVIVPFSAYSDLGDPASLALTSSDAGYLLTIKGGNSTDAYKANLEFADGLIVSRRVSSDDGADESWEETVYNYADEENVK